jgi:hypothetical protein
MTSQALGKLMEQPHHVRHDQLSSPASPAQSGIGR